MKKFFSYFAVSMTMILGLAVSSCTTDECKNVDCGTNGTCDAADGKCLCNAGYELGTDSKCSKLTSAKFIGTWKSSETCTPTVDNTEYSIVITASSDLTKVIITNFGRTMCGTDPLPVTATISGTNLGSFTETCATVNVTAGSASLSSDGMTLTVSYTLTDGAGDTYTCNAAMKKQ